MEKSTLSIGIDVGWSERQRSCAFAAIDPLNKLTWPDRADRYGTAELGCCRFRLSELLEFIRSLTEVAKQYKKLIVVIDGPLGPKGRPLKKRDVDSFFRCGEFKNRMQPSDVDNEAGRIYVKTTYQVAEAFTDAFELWMGGDKGALTITETNPTVGLALMNKKFLRTELPSRKRPLVPPSENKKETAIRAKSDFYWHAGANQVCSLILQCPRVASEMHHENVAGLYCLTVASAIRSGNELVMGRTSDGIYVFPDQVHADWQTDLKKNRIVAGEFCDLPTSVQPYDFSSWKRRGTEECSDVNGDAMTQEYESDLQDACNGDSTILILNDNGGVQRRHNFWLNDLIEPVTIRLVEQDRIATLVHAKKHGHSRQWRINCENERSKDLKANGIAKLYGLDVAHLSNREHVAIEVEIVKVGE